jgi:hypothetical protein
VILHLPFSTSSSPPTGALLERLPCKTILKCLSPTGYENDCGGFGDVILNVKTRQITVERNDRFEDYTPSSYEV